jgi:tetraacyldisaccharide 4'-kinase
LEVAPDTDPAVAGDEPVMLARATGCPVVVAPNRVAAVGTLLEGHPCDVIISDDGLQHYRLGRDVEVAVIDGERRLGNRQCLPAGPLREPAKRLTEVDLAVIHGGSGADELAMSLVIDEARRVLDPEDSRPLASFRGRTVHAVAGIGHPGRFFRQLRGLGLTVQAHPFPDHHRFTPQDLDLGGDAPVLMTEKDAIKCSPFARSNHWYVPARVRPSPGFELRLETLLAGVTRSHPGRAPAH